MHNTWLFIPSLFTVLNLLLGFLSILMSVGGSYELAAWFINFAVLCDGMDGKLARWTQSETAYGYELDSLADIVSFGVAPAILIGSAYRSGLGWIGILFSFLFLFAGAFRLVRFNVQSAGDRSEGYQGLPIPIAAMIVASLVLFRFQTLLVFHETVWLFILLSLSVLMISQIRYQWPQLIFDGSLKEKFTSLLICLAVLLMALLPRDLLFPFLVFYALKGIVIALVAQLQKWHVLPMHLNR